MGNIIRQVRSERPTPFLQLQIMRQGEPKEAKFLGFAHDVVFSHWERNPLGESQLEDHFLNSVFFRSWAATLRFFAALIEDRTVGMQSTYTEFLQRMGYRSPQATPPQQGGMPQMPPPGPAGMMGGPGGPPMNRGY